jgi:hypothetical protein
MAASAANGACRYREGHLPSYLSSFFSFSTIIPCTPIPSALGLIQWTHDPNILKQHINNFPLDIFLNILHIFTVALRKHYPTILSNNCGDQILPMSLSTLRGASFDVARG